MDKNSYVNKTKKINTKPFDSGFRSGKHEGILHDTLKSMPNGTVWLQDPLDPLAMPTYVHSGSGLMYRGIWERDYDTSKVYQKGDYFIMQSGYMKVFNGGGWDITNSTTTTSVDASALTSAGNWQTATNIDMGSAVTDHTHPYDASVKPYTPCENKFPPVFISVTYPNGTRGIIDINKIVEVLQTDKCTTITLEYKTITVQENVDVLLAKIWTARGIELKEDL
jgi:hypothetical protein